MSSGTLAALTTLSQKVVVGLKNGLVDLGAIKELKARSGISLPVGALLEIGRTIIDRRPCNLLVFGLGNDTALWRRLNNGRTAFLEDNPEWYSRIAAQEVGLEAYLVDFDSSAKDSEWYLENEWANCFPVPDEIVSTEWDIILVDGPAGHSTDSPGRMKSIFAASRLATRQTIIYVDDCNRPIESKFTNKYLSESSSIDGTERFVSFKSKHSDMPLLYPSQQPFFGERRILRKIASLSYVFGVRSILDLSETNKLDVEILKEINLKGVRLQRLLPRGGSRVSVTSIILIDQSTAAETFPAIISIDWARAPLIAIFSRDRLADNQLIEGLFKLYGGEDQCVVSDTRSHDGNSELKIILPRKRSL